MKKMSLESLIHGSVNDSILEVINSVPNLKFVSKLDEALEARGLTQAKLSVLTGLRPATISDFLAGEKGAITKSHLITMMIALRITDVSELIGFDFDDETKKQFEQEAKEWKEHKSMPISLQEIFMKNTMRMVK